MFNHHSHAMKIVGMITWFVTALAAIAAGLLGLGLALGKNWNIWDLEIIKNNFQWFVLPAHYIIGICGVISLISWFACLSNCEDGRHHNHGGNHHHENNRR